MLTQCHYCGVQVADDAWASERGVWSPDIVVTAGAEGCPCGQHVEGETCIYPGGWELPEDVRWLYWDHKIPKSRGGSNEPENLVPTCHSCNSRKGTTTYLAYLFHGSKKWGDVPDEVATRMAPSWGLGFIDKIERMRAS